MDLMTLANELVAGCREGRARANIDRLYAEDAVSVEAVDHGGGREARGRAAIHGKHDWWEANMQETGGSVSDPLPHGDDRFAVIFRAEGREKATGNTFSMTEVGIYTVADGRIVREEFFYPGI